MNNLKNQGLALIEVLITILVVAIGMLAYAALQVKTVNVTQESYFRSQAISVIEEATSKMRANSEFIAGDANNVYVSDNASGSFDEWCNFAPPAARPTLTCTGNCADDALATYNKESSCIKLFDSGVAEARMGAACFDNNGGDGDNCSNGSRYKMYVAWAPTSRADVDGTDTYDDGTNACSTKINVINDSRFSCVIVDIIP
ncbi:type IV pilus modification protein PilV [Kangiella sp. TOML190]|uniref:type IV pilus modification protein PilV n=1 Tax=Kangiella sp. TOML190 TaxID=2931351 RepID=UPI00203EA456|nr:type IV pilus modification protein PilV [Kangiella sp. TOML190]